MAVFSIRDSESFIFATWHRRQVPEGVELVIAALDGINGNSLQREIVADALEIVALRTITTDVHIGQRSVTQQVQSATGTHHGVGRHLDNAGIVMHFQTRHARVVAQHECAQCRWQTGSTEAGETVPTQVNAGKRATVIGIQSQRTACEAMIVLQV